ncbi:PLP-dependent transferase [Saitoella complicata NRRL Y-17804]|nr:PLP-dependent transferase [Saitoella complicata NRRL Y-17804]ODQ49814.1 PLP-dependent transferase [Saitoella complicata NRRL Y-17804]
MAPVAAFADVPLAPPDAIFHLTASYKADTFKDKINLGVGAYRDDDGKPWVLPVVKKADDLLRSDPTLDHEYLPIAGLPAFTSAAAKLVLGADSPAIKEDRVTSIQTISGTGANHLGAVFLSRFYRNGKMKCYLSNPTWANHKAIFANAGVETAEYAYFDPHSLGLDLAGMLRAMETCEEGSIFLLHACAHNPTGVDPTQEQWKMIAEVMERRRLFPFFDCAYQGFASGSLEKDAWAIRYFVQRGFEMLICQSFAKNFGLYGERAGCFHFIASTPDAVKRVGSQLAIIQRSEISNPPAYGARLVSLILNSPPLFTEWTQNLSTMASRIILMRSLLHSELVALGTPGSWDHIVDQIGMFSYTGLGGEEVRKLVEESHVYLTSNGRISMAGLTRGNVKYFARAVDRVVREGAGAGGKL